MMVVVSRKFVQRADLVIPAEAREWFDHIVRDICLALFVEAVHTKMAVCFDARSWLLFGASSNSIYGLVL